MAYFMIAYHGGHKPRSEKEGMAQMEKWKAWVGGLGEAVVNPGTPLPESKLVTLSSIEDDNDPNSMKGFAIFIAENMEAAIKIVKEDPFLENGGTIRVSEMKQI